MSVDIFIPIYFAVIIIAVANINQKKLINQILNALIFINQLILSKIDSFDVQIFEKTKESKFCQTSTLIVYINRFVRHLNRLIILYLFHAGNYPILDLLCEISGEMYSSSEIFL